MSPVFTSSARHTDGSGLRPRNHPESNPHLTESRVSEATLTVARGEDRLERIPRRPDPHLGEREGGDHRAVSFLFSMARWRRTSIQTAATMTTPMTTVCQ